MDGIRVESYSNILMPKGNTLWIPDNLSGDPSRLTGNVNGPSEGYPDHRCE